MKVLQKLYTAWVLVVFNVFMLLFLPGLLIPFLLGNRFSRIGYHFLWIWSWIFSKLTFIRYEIHGRERIRKTGAFIYVSNHTSFLDLPGLRLLIPGEFRPIAKKELLKIPVFGLIVRAATVVVDRSNHESRKKSIAFAKRMISHGISMLIFAEGTQNRTRELLQPFKEGAFRIALDTQTNIIPVVILGAGKLLPPGTLRLRPGKITLVVGEEIKVAGYTDAAVLKTTTFDVMKNMLTGALPHSGT
jgi:1-acyl-sn-glycerol-3-phosphate acyltransferase